MSHDSPFCQPKAIIRVPNRPASRQGGRQSGYCLDSRQLQLAGRFEFFKQRPECREAVITSAIDEERRRSIHAAPDSAHEILADSLLECASLQCMLEAVDVELEP